MSYLPGADAGRRIPRFRLTDTTPAVLQFQDGRRTAGELHVISLHGGLLLLPKPVHQGSVVELMFDTHRGPVLGKAEMLSPLSTTQQPFRFVALPEAHERILQTAFQSGLYRNIDEQEWIEELRAAVASRNRTRWPRGFNTKLLIGLITLLGCLLYVLYVQVFPH